MTDRSEGEEKGFRIQFRTKNYWLSEWEQKHLDGNALPLKKLARVFPIAELHVDIHRHKRTGTFHVKTTLQLPRRSLFTGERHVLLHPAYRQCIHKLTGKLKAFREMHRKRPRLRKALKGTRHEVVALARPDIVEAERAAAEGDYRAFRAALDPYEAPLAARVGRLIRRHPKVQARLGKDFLVSDVVESAFLNAFERFGRRTGGRLEDWLERQVAPSIDAFARRAGREKENVDIVRSAL